MDLKKNVYTKNIKIVKTHLSIWK